MILKTAYEEVSTVAKKHISTLNKLLFDNPVKQDKNATPLAI